MATIATHNGSKVCHEHNVRNPKVASKEPHIDPNGVHEVWHDERVRAAYKRLFGEAQEAYNAKQQKEERKIPDYYKHVCKDSKKHPCYEMIVGVYGKDVPVETGKEILKNFIQNWPERNPNLELIGAYYHADEKGEPHVHVDYIPVAKGCTRGMSVQNGLNKSFEQMGFKTLKSTDTAQMQWQRRENAYLESLCQNRGIHVDRPKERNKKHLETEQYKAEMKLVEASKTLESKRQDINDLSNQKTVLKSEIEALRESKGPIGRIGPLKKDVEVLQRENNRLKSKVSEKEKSIEDLQRRNQLLNKKIDDMTPSIDDVLLKAENEVLKKENSRLRETLNKIKSLLKEKFPTAYKSIENLFNRDHQRER